jgi:hypothetical protein
LGITWEERIGEKAAAEYKKKMSEGKKEWFQKNPAWSNPSKGKPNFKMRGQFAGKKAYNYDHTIYCWRNIISGELLFLTRQEFQLKVNARKENVHKLIKGTCKSVRGYILNHNTE